MAKSKISDNEMIRYLRLRGLTNGSGLGFHSGMMDIIADRFEELQASYPQSNWRETGVKTDGGQHIYRCASCGRTVNSYRSTAKSINEEYPYCHCGCEMINPY